MAVSYMMMVMVMEVIVIQKKIKSETVLTASVLKKIENTQEVQKNAF